MVDNLTPARRRLAEALYRLRFAGGTLTDAMAAWKAADADEPPDHFWANWFRGWRDARRLYPDKEDW